MNARWLYRFAGVVFAYGFGYCITASPFGPDNTPAPEPIDPKIDATALPANELPVITVAPAFQGNAAEYGPVPALFEFNRNGNVAAGLAVNFSIGGTASRDEDFQLWETAAKFAPGSSRTFITAIPRNDGNREGQESIVLTLLPGEAYRLSGERAATILIEDAFVEGLDGIIDVAEAQQYPLELDLTYLDASVSQNSLDITFGFDAAGGGIQKLALYLDTDQNPATGDIRAGHMGGFEYRVDIFATLTRDWLLTRLPSNPSEAARGEVQVTQLPQPLLTTPGGFPALSIPLQLLNRPSQVDVVGYSWKGGTVPGNTTIAAAGDRVPNFGVFDSSTGRVIVRQPRATVLTRVTDPAGDQINSPWDLQAVRFDVVGDQLSLLLELNAPIFRPGINIVAGLEPRGQIELDTDSDLSTGGIKMGGDIPTWGGDVRLFFSMTSGITVPTVHMQFDPSGTPVVFGQERNDGRWFATANNLVFQMSLATIDAFALEQANIDPVTGAFTPRTIRIPASSHMNAYVELIDQQFLRVADRIGTNRQALDTSSGQIVDPFAFDPARAVSSADPLEFGQFLSAMEITNVVAQIIRSNIVARVDLATLLQTQIGQYVELWLDTDLDSTTGIRADVGGGQSLGVDVIARTTADDTGIAPIYRTSVYRVAQNAARIVEGLANVRTTQMAGGGGGYTLTIPMSLLGPVGSRVGLLAAVGQVQGAGAQDIAPSQPIILTFGTPEPSGDSDSDGLPDRWELAHGLNPEQASDALLDTDKDGMSNAFEFLAGTDPLEPASVLRISGIRQSQTGTVLSFSTIKDKSYILEFANEVNSTNWETIGAVLIGTGGELNVPIGTATGNSPRFYRIRLLP